MLVSPRNALSRLAARAGAVGLGALLWLPTPVRADCPASLGEVNGDGVVNVADVQCVILSALGAAEGTGGPACLAEGTADLDCDAAVNVVDVQMGINAALKLPLSGALDANHDACPDSCQLLPTDPGAPAPAWQLTDIQPESAGFGDTYGMEAFKGRVTVAALLASW
jgi:hypothetical protein